MFLCRFLFFISSSLFLFIFFIFSFVASYVKTNTCMFIGCSAICCGILFQRRNKTPTRDKRACKTPSEIEWGLFWAGLAGSEGKYLFERGSALSNL